MLTLAESYLHRIDPFAIPFPASWQQYPFVPAGIRWYGLGYIAGFIVGWLLIWWLARSDRTLLPKINGRSGPAVSDFLTYLIFGVLVGGRLGHVLFYESHLLWEFDGRAPFWGLLAVNRGGMSSHGGILGVLIACWLFARSRRIDSLHVLDLAAFICPPGLMFGRIANFINGELWGQPLAKQESPPWWSIKYPDELLTAGYNLARLDEVRVELVPELTLHGQSFTNEQFLAAVRDKLIEGNPKVVALAQEALTAFYPSQIFQALAEGPMLMAVLLLAWLRPRKPGVVAASFLIAYGVLRIITEMFRDTSESFEQFFGLMTRGQALSGLMILAGLALLIFCLRRHAPAIGGLIRPNKLVSPKVA